MTTSRFSMNLRSTQNTFCLKIFSSIARIHVIQNTWWPVSPPEEAKVGRQLKIALQSLKNTFYLKKNFSANLIIHDIREVGGGSTSLRLEGKRGKIGWIPVPDVSSLA